ncbi:MAG: hypothetical protein KatS3mg059_0732 [Thermomicrobiales bacterium]|nr:MAG: hypothetical protein KatS3mg059_0732 [Thermomicrobiales bacterium]
MSQSPPCPKAECNNALADYVCRLPPDDPRLQRLGALALAGETFAPGQQTAYEIGRFHVFSTEATFDGFLSRLVELAEADHHERGQFGAPGAGRQSLGPVRRSSWPITSPRREPAAS